MLVALPLKNVGCEVTHFISQEKRRFIVDNQSEMMLAHLCEQLILLTPSPDSSIARIPELGLDFRKVLRLHIISHVLNKAQAAQPGSHALE